MWTWQDLRADPAIDRLDAAAWATLSLAEKADLDLASRPVLRDTGFVARLRSRIGAPATLTVIGQVGAGKSSFVNSLLGGRLLPASGRPTDGVISVLMYAASEAGERAEWVGLDGRAAPFATLADGLRFVDQAHTRAADQANCREVRFYLHQPLLQDLRIVNTPGLGDRLEQFEQVALEYLREDESDLIAWIFYTDAAANHHEIETFATALERRRDAVLGIVTRSMDGHYDEPGFDPRTDPGLTEVLEQVSDELGVYLSDAILYDSRRAAELVDRLRADPAALADNQFQADLDRSGYTAVERAIDEAARRPDGRVRSMLKRCTETTRSLTEAVQTAEEVFQARAAKQAEAHVAWLELQRDVIDPAQTELLGELKTVADDFAQEMAETGGRVAADAIASDFTLGKVLGNAISSRLAGKQPLAEKLSDRMQDDLADALRSSGFDKRLENEYRRIVRKHINDLELRLRVQTEAVGGPLSGTPETEQTGIGTMPLGMPGSVKRTFAGTMGRVIAGVAANMFKDAAGKTGKKATTDVATNIASEAVGTATKKAATSGAKMTGGQVFARLMTVYTVVATPFDLKKLFDEFGEGQEALINTVRKRFLAEKSTYERHINAQFATAVDELFAELREGVRQELEPDAQSQITNAASLVEADRLRRELAVLVETFDQAIW
jgi:hypothetical protein